VPWIEIKSFLSLCNDSAGLMFHLLGRQQIISLAFGAAAKPQMTKPMDDGPKPTFGLIGLGKMRGDIARQ
jgi:hypothetical protein